MKKAYRTTMMHAFDEAGMLTEEDYKRLERQSTIRKEKNRKKRDKEKRFRESLLTRLKSCIGNRSVEKNYIYKSMSTHDLEAEVHRLES